MEYFNNILEAIGNTPLIKINKINKGLKPKIFAKLESANPGGSVKDRIGLAMVEEAERSGKLKPGGTIIEATSGNTGIGLALAAAVKGYKSIFVVTDKVSDEKINYLRALGAEVIIVSNEAEPESDEYYVNVAKKIQKKLPNSIFVYQYSNPANPLIHYKTTGPEIWEQTDGKITHFVASIGTGGTISGTSHYLKDKSPGIITVAADPIGSIFKTYKETGEIIKGTPYLVEGIGQDCLPENVQFEYIDKIINVSDEQAFKAARRLTREEGIFCGGSTGANVHVVLEIAKDLSEEDVIVFIVADTGERYLTKAYNPEWLKMHGINSKVTLSVKDLIELKVKLGNAGLSFIREDDSVSKALKTLEEGHLDIIPVLDENNNSAGRISLSKIKDMLNSASINVNSPVAEIMDEKLPQINVNASIEELRAPIYIYDCVLIEDNGKIVNFITLNEFREIE